MINKIIRNFIAKQMAGRSDDGIMITLKDPQRVTLGENIMADLLMRNGIDPTAITSENQLKLILQQIKNTEAAAIRNTGIRNTESAQVFDIQGKEIPKGSQIMGGKAVETEAEIAARLEKENKKGLESLKQKMAKEKSRTQRISGNLRAENAQRYDIGEPKLDKDEYDYYREILGEDAEVDYYPVKGDETKEMLEAMVKEQQDEMAYMKRLYDKGALNPTPEESRRLKDTETKEVDETKNILKKLIDEDTEDMARGGRAGFFMGSQLPKGLATLRQMLKYYGKKSDAVKNPSDILKIVNPKQFNKTLEDPNIYRKFDMQKGLAAPEMIKILQKQMMGERKKTIEEMLGSAKNIKKLDDDALKYKNDMIEDMMKKGIDRKTAEGMAETISKMAEDVGLGRFKDTPKLTDEGILELENVLKNMETGGKKKRDLNADGGRIGLKDGMNRRTFLKLLGGLASIPIIGKIIKPLKTVKGVKNVPIIKTDNVPGKPEWFDQLVNKVIIEGDDVTKKFATADRQSIHQKTLDDGSVVRVTEDVDDGAVRVEYESEANVYGDPVQMQYKKDLPDEGNPRPTGEFTTAESGPVGRADGPDDYSIEIDEISGSSIKDLDSDVSKLKEYATGKGPTMKEIVQNKKRKDKAARITEGGEGEMDAVIRRQGEFIENDLVDLDPPDLASGGIARMLGE